MSRKSRRSHRPSPPPAKVRRNPTGAVAVALVVAGTVGAFVHDRFGAGAGASEAASSRSVPISTAPPFNRNAWVASLRREEVKLLPPPQAVTECAATPLPWHVDARNRDLLAAAAASPDLTPAQRNVVRSVADCGGGAPCAHPVPLEFLTGLSSGARAALYPLLAQLSANQSYAYPFRFPGTDRGKLRARLSDLGDPAFDLLWQLSYPADGHVVFAELPVLCGATSPAKRIDLQRALNVSVAVRLSLPLDAGTDVGAVVDYFHRPEMRDALAAMARAPGGGSIDVAELLPPFARNRMDRFPAEGDPDVATNCFWAALNFLRPSPDDSLSGVAEARAELDRRYARVPLDEIGYGDVLAFEGEAGKLLHTAVRIVDDVYFTRNGHIPARPWTMMRLAELEVRYGEGAKRGYRSKSR